MEWCEKEITIAEVDSLLFNDYEVETYSPDGWVKINNFINKGIWEEYILNISDIGHVRTNENHLYETRDGWLTAKELSEKDNTEFLTILGWKEGKVIKTNNSISIVDIEVDHPNHRYYTNGISSHNTAVGKSLFMCHCAAACMSMGKNVLYITLELAEEEVAKRIDVNLMNVTFDDLMAMPKEMYERRAKKLYEKTRGKLIIKEYAPTAASVIHFKSLLNDLLLKQSFKPDIIFVDYLNICMSSRVKMSGSINSYTYIKNIAEELRGLAVEYNLPVFTATQTNRAGFSSSDIDLTDTSESFGLPMTADFMFALQTNEKLEELGQIAVKQLKNRYSDANVNKRFIIGVDKSKMRLYDVENSAQSLVDSSQQQSQPRAEIKSPLTKDKFKSLKV